MTKELKQISQIITPMVKAGRCADGFEGGHGSVVHGVADGIEFGMGKALCRTQPGRRSVGWVKPYKEKPINCASCLKKMGKHHHER